MTSLEEGKGLVDFFPRTSEPDWVEILDADENSSFVGRQGGRQPINIFNWNFRFIICHELAHCLGYWHEQSKPDRDQYVQINWGNIENGQADNFVTHGDAGQYGSYDFDSVMHYGQYAFSINGFPTITVLSPNQSWQNRIGQRTHLSRLDKLTMSFLYPQPNWRFVDQSYIGPSDGSFSMPFQQFDSNIASQIPSSGVVWIQPGTYSSIGTYTKAMTLQAPLGGVILD